MTEPTDNGPNPDNGPAYAQPPTAEDSTELSSSEFGGRVTMEFVTIQPGVFTMGSEKGGDNEKPPRCVTISRPFRLAKYHVTLAQWDAVMGTTPRYEAGSRKNVASASWHDCQRFLKKLNAMIGGAKFVLPTEAQWEYACRAGSTTQWCFGDDEQQLAEFAWYRGKPGAAGPVPVGRKMPNAWGLYDMHGNVMEWCQDRYGAYSRGAVTDPRGARIGWRRVLRGGCWFSPALETRSASRYRLTPGTRSSLVGFRPARLVALE